MSDIPPISPQPSGMPTHASFVSNNDELTDFAKSMQDSFMAKVQGSLIENLHRQIGEVVSDAIKTVEKTGEEIRQAGR